MHKALVIGKPIKHSLSPKLHNYWLKEKEIEGEYLAEEVDSEKLEEFILNLQKRNISGINITIPHKEKAYEIVKKHGNLSELAKKIEAINTIYFKDGKMYGDNTDYFGFVENLKIKAQDKKIEEKKYLIIGAGGAAKAIIAGLLANSDNKIIIVNRSQEKLQKLKQKYGEKIDIGNLEDLEEKINKAEIIVNTSSMGLNGENEIILNHAKINQGKIFYDIVYKPEITKFLKDAKTENQKIVTGIGMLICQAIPAFRYFFGQEVVYDSGLDEYLLNKD